MSALDDLAHREIWVRWRSEKRGGKPTKVPYSPTGDGRASSTDPSTWGTREEAERGNHGDGLGIILAPLGANRHLGGIDLDGCINDDGDVAQWARDIVELVMSYTEVSPSGHGLKIYFEHDPAETLPEPKGWRSNVRIKGQTNGSGKSPGIELYLHDRYFAVTDDTFEHYDTIRVVDLDALNAVQKRMVAVADKPKAVNDYPQRHDHGQRLILDAIAHIPNPDLHWNDWTRIGMAIFAATEGSAAGHAAFLNFSAKSSRYERSYSDERWDDWHRSPPDRLTAGTIFHEAKAGGWQDPRQRKEPPPDYRAEPEGDAAPKANGAACGIASEGLPAGVAYDDFVAYMVQAKFIYMPTGQLWPASSVNARLPWIGKTSPAAWLAQNRPVEQMTWMPGAPQIILDRLIVEGGWVARPGARAFNLYKSPALELGDATEAGPWCDLIRKLWPDEAEHLFNYFAHRVQHPDDKINHALVLGGPPGIGKDTVLAALRQAVGPWNVQSISPPAFVERFNVYARAVVLIINEARDSEYDRYQFYEHMKVYAAAPPDVLRINEKHIQEYYIPNLLGPIITTNHKSNGIYLPADDRRHFVVWSDLTEADFAAGYWSRLWRWYDAGGFGHVAAWLARRDLSAFNPKAPPPKTEAFWTVVNTNRATEDAELADVLDKLGNPAVTTLDEVQRHATGDFHEWLHDRKNRRNLPFRFEACGYASVDNPDAKDGLWKINGARQVVYGHRDHDRRTHIARIRLINQGGKP